MTEERRFLRKLYWSGFFLRLLLGVTGWVLMHTINLPLLQDALYYEEVGAYIAKDWLGGKPSVWLQTDGQNPYQPVAMVTLIACFYVLTLGVRALPVLIAMYCAVTSLTPLLTYRIAQELGASPRAARFSGWLVAASPAFVFWSGALYKEGLILLVLNLGFYHALRLQSRWRPQSMAYLALSILGLCFLRLYLAVVMCLVLCLGLMLGQSRDHAKTSAASVMVRQSLVALVFSGLMVAAGFMAQVQDVLPADLRDGLATMNLSRRDLASTPSGYFKDVQIDTPEEAIRFLPVGTAYFLAVPLPWQTGSIRQNLAIPDTTVWLLLYPLILVGMFHSLRRNFRAAVLLIVASLAVACFYGMFIANIGTAYRLRVQIWLLWAAFAGIGWEAVFQPRGATSARMPRHVLQLREQSRPERVPS